MARFTDRQQTPSRPPMYQPPGARPPRIPADPALQQRSWAALIMAMLGLFAVLMTNSGNVRRGVYVIALALIVALLALWLAISSMSRARRGGTGRPRGVILATVLGTVCCVFSGSVLLGFVLFWPQLTQFSDCLSGANTVAAQQACQQQLSNSVGSEVSVLGG